MLPLQHWRGSKIVDMDSVTWITRRDLCVLIYVFAGGIGEDFMGPCQTTSLYCALTVNEEENIMKLKSRTR